MILDDQYRIHWVNEAMADQLGVIPDEAVGLICYEHVHGTNEALPFCPYTKLLSDGQRHMAEFHEERLDRDFLVSVSPFHDMEGHLTGSVHVAHDITWQKRTEEALKGSEERYRELAELLPQPVFEIDMACFFTYTNRSALEAFGYTQENIEKGVYVLELFHPMEKERIVQNIRKRLAGVEFEDHEYTALRKDGSTFPTLIYSIPIIRNEKTVGLRGVVLDINQRKKAEENLQRTQQHLENLVQERTKNLENTNRELKEEIEQRKLAEEALKKSAEKIKLFAYSVIHDLKNPAIALNLLTQALNRNYKDILNEKGKSYCEHILGASEQLATLVEQINVYMSTKEAPLIIERVNLNHVFDTIRDEFSVPILNRQISWSQPEKRLEINVDSLSILRVIRNFVDNALKYGGDELSEIEIGYEESDEFHIVFLKDDGISISERDSKKIFSPFERSGTSIGIEGTGLGLAIVKEIANQHKGKVWAEFGLEKGVIFFISIPKDLKPTE